MAADGYFPAQFFCVTETGFYFEDLEEDNFQMSPTNIPDEQILIQSKNNKFLTINYEEFQVKNLNKKQQRQPESKFNVKVYNDTTLVGKSGRAVMLYAQKDGKTLVVSCNDKHEIHPVEMDLPSFIGSSGHGAVFYQKELLPSRYLLESSLFPSEFLGFEPDGDRSAVSKLILRHKSQDEVDESCEITFAECHST